MEKTNQPLYQQLMEDVRSQIENSLLLPGDKLPTEREFIQNTMSAELRFPRP